MRKDTSSTQMERKEEGRGADKAIFLSVFGRGPPPVSSVQQEMRSLLSAGEVVPTPFAALWSSTPPTSGTLPLFLCIFNAFLPTKFFHLACKQAQDSFMHPSKISLDSHPLILYFSKSSPRGYHILLFSFWVFLKYCFPDSTLFLLICCCSQPLWM